MIMSHLQNWIFRDLENMPVTQLCAYKPPLYWWFNPFITHGNNKKQHNITSANHALWFTFSWMKVELNIYFFFHLSLYWALSFLHHAWAKRRTIWEYWDALPVSLTPFLLKRHTSLLGQWEFSQQEKKKKKNNPTTTGLFMLSFLAGFTV